MQRSLPKKRLAIGQQSEFVCQSSLNLNSAQISHREMSLPHINSYSLVQVSCRELLNLNGVYLIKKANGCGSMGCIVI